MLSRRKWTELRYRTQNINIEFRKYFDKLYLSVTRSIQLTKVIIIISQALYDSNLSALRDGKRLSELRGISFTYPAMSPTRFNLGSVSTDFQCRLFHLSCFLMFLYTDNRFLLWVWVSLIDVDSEYNFICHSLCITLIKMQQNPLDNLHNLLNLHNPYSHNCMLPH